MRLLWTALLLSACGSTTNVVDAAPNGMTNGDVSAARLSPAEETYRACVHTRAAQIGTRASLTAEQADAVAGQCRHLLHAAASEVVAQMPGRPMTNLPAGMETEDSRISVAMTQIEHTAKMEISDDVPPLPPA